MAKDAIKVQLNNIATTAVEIFKEKRGAANYDFTRAAKTMAQEAFDLGLKVGQGKISADQPEEPSKTKKPKPE